LSQARRKIVSEKEQEEQETSENPQETTPTGEEAPDLNISVGVENGNVIVLYSQRLTTVSMPPDAAEKMADALKRHAADARKMREEAGV
jgi:hypothetical protein